MKRKPPKGNTRRVRHIDGNIRFTITNKVHEVIQAESFAEYKFVLRLERDKAVASYTSQPETIHWIDNSGRKHRYTPDFQVIYTNQQVELCEITMKQRRNQKQSLRDREIIARGICEARGWRYRVFTEDTLPNDTELANLRTLITFASDIYRDHDTVQHIQYRLRNNPMYAPALVSQLIDDGIPEPFIRPTISHLLWHNRLATNFNQLLFDELEFLPNIILKLGGECE